MSANRWTKWARSIARQHPRLARRRESLALIVLRLRRPLNIIRKRFSFTKIIQPRLQLAINASVKLVHLRQEQHVYGGPTNVSSHSRTEQCVFGSSGVLRTISERRPQDRREAGGRQAEVATVQNSAAGLTPPPRVLKPPLNLVFERLEVNKRSTHSKRVEVLIHQQAQSVVERVTQQSRRLETIIVGTNTLIERLMSSSSVTATQPPRLLKTAAAMTRVIEKPPQPPQVTTVVESAQWFQDKAPVAGLNIDQITDQVVRQLDRRVVAAKERMGRF
ncbi:MAG TPA: hypothetical protein VIW74_08855 [Pyrinomonadaceae bacterium]